VRGRAPLPDRARLDRQPNGKAVGPVLLVRQPESTNRPFRYQPSTIDFVSLGVRCFHRLPMRSAATIDPHAHAPARLDLACNSLSFAGKCRRRRTLNGRPPVREPAILEPRGGDSAWEDGGSAVLQVPLLQPVVRFSQRRRVGSLSRVVHRVGPLIRERWITKPAICVCISFFGADAGQVPIFLRGGAVCVVQSGVEVFGADVRPPRRENSPSPHRGSPPLLPDVPPAPCGRRTPFQHWGACVAPSNSDLERQFR
jgi:hypothetical protein